jgi:hypothetical protein
MVWPAPAPVPRDAGPAPAVSGELASSVVEAIDEVVAAVRAGMPPGAPGGDRHG